MPISKLCSQVLCSAAVVAVVASPATVLAIEGSTPTTENSYYNKSKTTQTQKTDTSKNRCQAISKIAQQLQSQLTERKTKVDSKKAAISVKLGKTAQNRETQLEQKRAEWDQKRQENFEKLRQRAQTDEQKQSVETYITAMTEAIKNRREANDTAFATFKSELAALKATFGQSSEESISAASARMSQAANNAQAACEGGQDISAIKQTLKTEIEAARQQLKTSRESVGKSEQLKAIVQKRNDAIKANLAAFKEATEQARTNLKAAFTVSDQN